MTDRHPRLPRFAVGLIAMIVCGSTLLIDSVRGTPRTAMPPLPPVVAQADVDGAPTAGILFACGADPVRMAAVHRQMDAYLREEEIPPSWVILRTRDGALIYSLNTAADDTATLDFAMRREMDLHDARIELPTAVAGRTRTVHTVSRKEIVLALLQHGRLTEFDCRVEALREQVGLRQNIVAWAETLNWTWPDGGPSKWNGKYWGRRAPLSRHRLHEAVNNAFMEQRRYSMGCYAATKLVVIQGVLDYYRRVQPDAAALRRIEAHLSADGEPLAGIEPGAMWYFEADYSSADGARPGKLVDLQHGVAADNFVPGDWSYLRNTDADSYRKTGYEGSNMIYLGRDRFDDYYNDHHHFYSFRQKLNEVYQWRHGVFSRVRDAAKIRPLPEAELLALASAPAAGGLLESYRGVVSPPRAAPSPEQP